MKHHVRFSMILITAFALSLLTVPVMANKYDDALELFKQKNYQGAITPLEEHCNQYPKDPRGGDLLAQCYVKTKQYDKAIDRLKIVLEHHPEYHQSQFLMGVVLLSQKKTEDAKKYINEAIKLDSENANYQGIYGSILMQEKKYEEAKTALSKALKSDPNDAKLNFDYGRALFNLGDYEKALQPLSIAVKSESNKDTALVYLGSTQLQLKKYDEAIQTLKQASEKAPSDDKIMFNLGQAYEAKVGDKAASPKEYQTTIDAFSKAVQINGAVADYQYRLGKANELAASTIYEKSAGDKAIADEALSYLNKAKTAYEAAIKLDPQSPAKDRLKFTEDKITNINNPQTIEEEVKPE